MNCVRNDFWVSYGVSYGVGYRVGNGLATDLKDTTSYCVGKVLSFGSGIVQALVSFTNEEDPLEMHVFLKTARSVARFVVEMFLVVGGVFSLFATIPVICFGCCLLSNLEMNSDELAARKRKDEIADLAFITIRNTTGYVGKIDLTNFVLKKDEFRLALTVWTPSKLMTDGQRPYVEEGGAAELRLPATQGQTGVDEKTFLAARKMMHLAQKNALKAVMGRAGRFSLFTIPHKKEVVAFCLKKLEGVTPNPEAAEDFKVLYTSEDLMNLQLETE